MATGHEVIQVVDENGVFNERMEDFVRSSHVGNAGTDYQIVAITGPQSSGKSTLMNVLFGTRFEEMDAISGRTQTTKGIWLAYSKKLADPKSFIIDLEGSDGRERGEDDSSFERQSSLFALAIADILVVNMWAKDVGREAGAGKPLLKTIFQVNLKLFAPDPTKQRTVLLFVFRDRTKTPLQRLVQTWEDDLQQMWASITKPPQYEGNSFTDFFEVKYASLPNFEDREEEFLAESVLLTKRFTTDGYDSLVRADNDKLPGNVLTMNLKKIWEVIKDQKDLNLPAHKVMVANVRCEEILLEKLKLLQSDEQWVQLSEGANTQLKADFGRDASQLLSTCLAAYDEEAQYFESGVRSGKRQELKARASTELKAGFDKQLALLQMRCLAIAKEAMAQTESDSSQFLSLAQQAKTGALEEFTSWVARLSVPEAGWDTAPARAELAAEIEGHMERLIASKIAEAVGEAERSTAKAFAGPVISLLESCPSDLWPRLNRLVITNLPRQSQALVASVQGYGLSKEELDKLQSALTLHAEARISAHLKEAANTALSRMKERFSEVFGKDEASLPRRWGPRDSITAVMHKAYQEVASLLAQIAVIRLGKSQAEYAIVDEGISALAEQMGAKSWEAGSPAGKQMKQDFDIQSASEWPGVQADRVLLDPVQCRQLWRQFTSDSAFIVQQAQATQEANRAASNRMPPLWALAAIAVLGMNEFLVVLYNPLWLLLLIIVFLFAKTVYQELDIDGELQAGLLPGLLSISVKLWPTLTQVTQRTGQQVMRFIQNPQEVVSSGSPQEGPPGTPITKPGARREMEMSNLSRTPLPSHHKAKAI